MKDMVYQQELFCPAAECHLHHRVAACGGVCAEDSTRRHQRAGPGAHEQCGNAPD